MHIVDQVKEVLIEDELVDLVDAVDSRPAAAVGDAAAHAASRSRARALALALALDSRPWEREEEDEEAFDGQA